MTRKVNFTVRGISIPKIAYKIFGISRDFQSFQWRKKYQVIVNASETKISVVT